MRGGKACDEQGIIAEMLRDGSEALLKTTLEVSNEILSLQAGPPNSWKQSMIKVLFKKGERDAAKNYRPISIIPILYKLFSRMLCNRLTVHIAKHQDVEQAAYRKGFSTEDHLLAASLLIEKSREFNYPLWIALVDFEKAFDMVSHDELWEVLTKQGVPSQLVMLLRSLHEGQTARVQAGAQSRSFSIMRGVKQGDPISALLFIAIMQDLCGKLQQKWAKTSNKRKGHPLGVHVDNSCARALTNLRFADDVLLTARSKQDIV